MDYSTKRVSQKLIDEVKNALQSVSYGSVEIFVTDNNVTQITTRTIKKTSITLSEKKNAKKTAKIVSHTNSTKKKDTPKNTKIYTDVVTLRSTR